MALFLPLEDDDFWRGLMKTDAEFRACMESVVGSLEVEIDIPTLEFSFDLSAQIDVRITDLQVRFDKIVGELPCIDIIIDFLEGQVNPEAVSFREAMLARKEVLLVEQVTVQGQLNVLPGFSASTKDTTDNLITNGKNASFLGGILDSLSP